MFYLISNFFRRRDFRRRIPILGSHFFRVSPITLSANLCVNYCCSVRTENTYFHCSTLCGFPASTLPRYASEFFLNCEFSNYFRVPQETFWDFCHFFSSNFCTSDCAKTLFRITRDRLCRSNAGT